MLQSKLTKSFGVGLVTMGVLVGLTSPVGVALQSPTLNLPSVVVYADEGDSVVSGSVEVNSTAYLNDAGALSTFSQIAKENNTEAGVDILSYNAGKRLIIFDTGAYKSLLISERKTFMTNVLSDVKASKSLSAKSKNKIYNFVSSQDGDVAKLVRNLEADVTADIATGSTLYAPFQNPVTTVLGLIALGVFIGMGLSIVLDISYLTLPMVKISVQNTEGIVSKLISPEAISTSKDVELMGSGNYLATYFARRVWVVALVFIALGYLNSGMIVSVVGDFIQLLSNAGG